MIAGWSSLVARKAHNLEVVRSNRAPATNITMAVAKSYDCCRFLVFRQVRPSGAVGGLGGTAGMVSSAG